jgi:hypothetical protein
MPTRQERFAQSEANPANFKDLLWRRLARHSPLVTALNRCTADGCRELPLLAVILQEANVLAKSGKESRSGSLLC